MPRSNRELQNLAKEIYVIKNNHLKHMDERIRMLDTRVERMDQRLWAILIILIGSVIVGMLK